MAEHRHARAWMRKREQGMTERISDMTRFALAAVVVAGFAVSGCQMSPMERDMTGALAGGAAGLVAASVLRTSPRWTLVAALGGAAAGVLVARNTATNECAYSNGRGQYYVRPCR